MDENAKKEHIEDNHVLHTHPIPASELINFSIDRDFHSEQDISRYVELQTRDETVQHVEKIKQEVILGEVFEIWDVTTDLDRFWVITNLTNLYSQKHFPSLDYTLSFHIGLMIRLRSRPNSADSKDPSPFDEVFRRQEQSKIRFDHAVEAEDYQAVGMQLRECLISLISALRRRVEFDPTFERPQDSNFIDWSALLMNMLCPGKSNQKLRRYLKNTSKETWQLVNWLTHDRNANDVSSSIAIYACDTVVGHFVQIFERKETENIKECPICKSRNIRTHFDLAIEPDGDYYVTCGVCDWSSHPMHSTT